MGNEKRIATIKSSSIRNTSTKNNERPIKKDFRNIPKTMENKTSPFLYSFFRGLKKVLKSKGTENI